MHGTHREPLHVHTSDLRPNLLPAALVGDRLNSPGSFALVAGLRSANSSSSVEEDPSTMVFWAVLGVAKTAVGLGGAARFAVGVFGAATTTQLRLGKWVDGLKDNAKVKLGESAYKVSPFSQARLSI